MKNNIDISTVLNRKIIIELRYDPKPIFLDVKGSLIQKIESLKLFPESHWGIGESAVKLSDSNKNELERNRIHVELNRLSFLSTKIDSINDYYSKFESIHKVAKEVLGEFEISRIGCRIQGSYKCKSTDFKELLSNFEKSFPNKLFLEHFPVKDLRFQVNYQNGMYHVGPVGKNDPFLRNEFTHPDRNENVGIGLDTDNFLLRTSSDKLNGTSKIKDVFTASLAVEKSMVENLSDF